MIFAPTWQTSCPRYEGNAQSLLASDPVPTFFTMNEKSSFIRATRIGGHAYRCLTTRPHTGRVVSSFSGGINLLFEDAEAFVPVQIRDVPLHPWAIEIPGEPLLFGEGTPVRSEEGKLSLGGTRIALSTAQVEELSLPRFSAQGVTIARRNFPILARFVEKAKKMHQPDPFQPEIDSILTRWRETGDPAILLNLIGLGAGSTPSGDDIIVGILAGLCIFEHVNDRTRETLSRLRTGISANVSGSTSLPSAQMLLATCDRSFAEPILKLVAGITSPNIQENNLLKKADCVFQLGHHSGLAMLLGLKAELVP